MAKRKTSGGARRKSAARGAGRSASTRKGGARTSSARGKKTGSRTKRASKTRARKPARSTATASSSRRSAAATRSKKKTARKTAASRSSTRRAASKTARKSSTARRKTTARAANPAAVTRRAGTSRSIPVARKRPDLSRPRRMIEDDDLVPTPPSSLDLDRSASASRSGRRELRERFDEHTETGPAVTGGDIDADWESAYSVGDEAPGGDNPTPDQDIVDDIGRAVGVEYQDNEELKSEEKIARRDRHRWELDPASSEDYEER